MGANQAKAKARDKARAAEFLKRWNEHWDGYHARQESHWRYEKAKQDAKDQRLIEKMRAVIRQELLEEMEDDLPSYRIALKEK